MKKRYVIMAAAVLVSALLQAFTMNIFLEPVGLLPSGFTGIALKKEKLYALAIVLFVALNIALGMSSQPVVNAIETGLKMFG